LIPLSGDEASGKEGEYKRSRTRTKDEDEDEEKK
jgi:hypothetical protein